MDWQSIIGHPQSCNALYTDSSTTIRLINLNIKQFEKALNCILIHKYLEAGGGSTQLYENDGFHKFGALLISGREFFLISRVFSKAYTIVPSGWGIFATFAAVTYGLTDNDDGYVFITSLKIFTTHYILEKIKLFWENQTHYSTQLSFIPKNRNIYLQFWPSIAFRDIGEDQALGSQGSSTLYIKRNFVYYVYSPRSDSQATIDKLLKDQKL
uniref:Uncharacterized protein n=1 Tax=Glossina pallidipes TaxID=7398 RepID=A0A1A9ZNI6_GLOPL